MVEWLIMGGGRNFEVSCSLKQLLSKDGHKHVLTSVGLWSWELPVPCACNSHQQLSLAATIGCFGISAILPCHVQAGAVCTGKAFIQLQYME